MNDDVWYRQLFQDYDDFNNTCGLEQPPVQSSSGTDFSIEHNQRLDAPDKSDGAIFDGSLVGSTLNAQNPSLRDTRFGLRDNTSDSHHQSIVSRPAKTQRKKANRRPRILHGYPCEDCMTIGETRTFDTEGDLRKHCLQVHTAKSDRPIGCEFCEKRFLFPKDQKRHLKTHARYPVTTDTQRYSIADSPLAPSTIDMHDPGLPPILPLEAQAPDRRDFASAKRLRMNRTISDSQHDSTATGESQDAEEAPLKLLEAKLQQHETAEACLAAGCLDLRTFISLNATHITIIATNSTEVVKFAARHEVQVRPKGDLGSRTQISSGSSTRQMSAAEDAVDVIELTGRK